MTRSTLRRTLRRVYVLLAFVLGISLVSKLADHVPGLAGTPAERVLKDAYEFLRDMSLLIATGGVAYVTDVFQKRHSFIAALKEEWRDIIEMKSQLYAYTQIENPTTEDYVAAFCKVSETLDNMRTVYRNVGETGDLVGLYPFAPLHDMRRALQTLDPRKATNLDLEARNLVRDAILQSFYAVRETFLEELDLEEPDRPLLISMRREKKTGAQSWALRAQERQRTRRKRTPSPDPRIDDLLERLFDKEQQTTKPWRQGVTPAQVQAQAAPNGRA
ncbi:MAG: hypothetical protein AB7K67_11040 [Hyphomicrobiaceae bacterium]